MHTATWSPRRVPSACRPWATSRTLSRSSAYVRRLPEITSASSCGCASAVAVRNSSSVCFFQVVMGGPLVYPCLFALELRFALFLEGGDALDMVPGHACAAD